MLAGSFAAALGGLLLAQLPALSSAYSWKFASVPTQCGNLNITIDGTGGQAPYRALIIPFGSSPITNEVRRIQDIPFNDSSSLSFKLRFPQNSQFVLVVSDASGFGTGGTSAANTVQSSDDDSCYDSSKSVSPDFWLSLEPSNLVQCNSTRIWWDPANVESTPSFVGVIPGGNAFEIPNGTLSQIVNFGTGFNWTPSVRTGTTVIVTGGDSRGLGTAGSANLFIQQGNSDNSTCINDSSPSSTAGTPAGGAYPTSTTTGSSSSSGGGGKSNVGAIVGGVVGGVVGMLAILLGLFFFLRRRKSQQSQKERPVDLLNEGDDDDEGDDANNRQELPQYYQPDPFTLPEPTVAASSARESSDAGDADPLVGGVGGAGGARASADHRHSLLRPGTPSERATSSGTRKTAAGPTPLRPVNIIQHEDGARFEPPGADDGETIELPPAYTNIKRDPSRRVARASAEEEDPAPVASGSGAAAAAPASASAAATAAPEEGSPVPSPPAPAVSAA